LESIGLLLSQIKPGIEPQKKNGKYKDKRAGKLDINNLFHIMDDERPSICQGRIMLRSQPELKVSKRTIPAKNLD